MGYHDVCVCGRACGGDSGFPCHRQGMTEKVEVGSEELVILECKVKFNKHRLLVLVGCTKWTKGWWWRLNNRRADLALHFWRKCKKCENQSYRVKNIDSLLIVALSSYFFLYYTSQYESTLMFTLAP